MFKAARLAKIKEVLLDRDQVDVSTLSALLNVSDVTIRSDLEELEKENFIVRTHGGAVLNEDYVKQKTFQDNLAGSRLEYNKYKEYVGQIAADMIEDYEWVFIGQGTTCYYIARALVNRPNINVVTNNLYVAGIMAQNLNSRVIVTGGDLSHNMMYLTGDLFMQAMGNIFFSKAFIGVGGVDFKSGFTVHDSSELYICNKVKGISKELIVAADYTKFNETSFMRIGPLNIVDAVITNENIPDEYKSYFFENGVKIFTSYKIKASSVRGDEQSC